MDLIGTWFCCAWPPREIKKSSPHTSASRMRPCTSGRERSPASPALRARAQCRSSASSATNTARRGARPRYVRPTSSLRRNAMQVPSDRVSPRAAAAGRGGITRAALIGEQTGCVDSGMRGWRSNARHHPLRACLVLRHGYKQWFQRVWRHPRKYPAGHVPTCQGRGPWHPPPMACSEAARTCSAS